MAENRKLLERVHALLNRESIGRLCDGHHDTHADGWQWWMSQRADVLRLVTVALSASSTPPDAAAVLPGAEPPADAWRPIGTCPHDADVFFWLVPLSPSEAFIDTSGRPIVSTHAPYWHRGRWGSWGSLSQPTHWMPMFLPPRPLPPTPHEER